MDNRSDGRTSTRQLARFALAAKPSVKTHVEFQSDEFPPYEGEEDEINPGRYGKRLAEFLVRGLTEKGFEPLEPIAEDWGWVVPIKNDGFRLWIGCGNYDEYPDGFLCFIEPHRPTIRRLLFLWKIDTSAKVTALQQAVDQVLSANPGVRNKRWWTYTEFNRPRQLSLSRYLTLLTGRDAGG